MPSPNKARTVILTCSVAAVTVMGALYGADLKSSQTVIKDSQKRRDVNTEEMLAQLHTSRKVLLARITELETKIAELKNKRRSTQAPNSSSIPP